MTGTKEEGEVGVVRWEVTGTQWKRCLRCSMGVVDSRGVCLWVREDCDDLRVKARRR